MTITIIGGEWIKISDIPNDKFDITLQKVDNAIPAPSDVLTEGKCLVICLCDIQYPDVLSFEPIIIKLEQLLN